MLRFAGKPLLIAATMALSACAQMTTGAETVAQLPRMAVEGTADFFGSLFTRPELVVEVQEISRLPQCNSTGREPSVEVFTDPAALKTWEDARGVKLVPANIDLPAGNYAIAEMGERNTGGYALVVSRTAAAKDDALFVKASFLVPGNAEVATQVVTSPCSLVRLPIRSYSRVLLLDQSNTVRASWAAPGVKG